MHARLRNVDLRLRETFGGAFGLAVDTAPEAGTLTMVRVPSSPSIRLVNRWTCAISPGKEFFGQLSRKAAWVPGQRSRDVRRGQRPERDHLRPLR